MLSFQKNSFGRFNGLSAFKQIFFLISFNYFFISWNIEDGPSIQTQNLAREDIQTIFSLIFSKHFSKKTMDGWPHIKYNSQKPKPKQKYVNKMVIWTWNRQEGKKIKTINQIHSSYYRFGGFAKYLTLGWLHLEIWNFLFSLFGSFVWNLLNVWADKNGPF